MASLIDTFISIGILTIILWALDKYKKYRIDSWKKSFIVSAVYWLVLGIPVLYFALNKPPIYFLLLIAFIGTPFTALVIRAISSWIIYPFLDSLKKNK